MRYNQNNIMDERRNELKKDKVYAALNTFAWMVVIASVGVLAVVYAIDNFIPVP